MNNEIISGESHVWIGDVAFYRNRKYRLYLIKWKDRIHLADGLDLKLSLAVQE